MYSDYEGSFESKPWVRFMNEMGVKMVQMVGSADGVDRFNRTIKKMLQTRLDAPGNYQSQQMDVTDLHSEVRSNVGEDSAMTAPLEDSPQEEYNWERGGPTSDHYRS